MGTCTIVNGNNYRLITEHWQPLPMTGMALKVAAMESNARLRLISALSERMTELRITTHKQLADLVGRHESTISRLFSEKDYVPRPSLLHALETALQFSYGYLDAIENETDTQAMSVPLPSLSFAQALTTLRVRRYPLIDGLSTVLSGWEPLLSDQLWRDWEDGRTWPNQKELQAIARMLELSPYERGWLFGLSGVPVEWANLEDETRQDLQAEVDAWPYGPAIIIGQPFGMFLTVNGLACDLVNVPRNPQVLEHMCLSKPNLLQLCALPPSFMSPYCAAANGYEKNYCWMIAMLKSRLEPYLSRSEVIDQLKRFLINNPEFARQWEFTAPSEAATSAWDMTCYFSRSVGDAQVILGWHAFWSPYLPDQRIEIIRMVPVNGEAVRFVQEGRDRAVKG
jgi:transcriptional regulator with XRE-family HTH domain